MRRRSSKGNALRPCNTPLAVVCDSEGIADGVISCSNVRAVSIRTRSPAVASHLIYDLKAGEVAFFGSPASSGFTDPTIGMRYVGGRSKTRPCLAR